MRLQIAIDLTDTKGCIDLVDKVHDVVDIVEVGTPVIMLEGVHAVEALRKKYPDLCILADTKIADGARLEAGYACKAGADIVTVLGVSDDLTVQGAIEEAHQNHKEVLVDLINVPDVIRRSEEIDRMGADYICVHTASDVQNTGKNPIEELRKISRVVKKAGIACAGGINMSTIHDIIAEKPSIIIIGSGITKAEDPHEAAKAYHNIIQEEGK